MINFTLGAITYTLIDEGIANFFILETLRHGTNPIDYIKIRLEGGDPNYGGKSNEYPGSEGWFYIFKDHEIKLENFGVADKTIEKILSFYHYFIPKKILPRIFVARSGYKLTTRLIPIKESSNEIFKKTKIGLSILGAVTSLTLCPTLKFRFAEIDPKRLENDEDFDGLAYKSAKKIEPWRIGILGSLLTGVNFGWFGRAKKHPSRTFSGLLQAISGISLTILAIKLSQKDLRPLILGALLA